MEVILLAAVVEAIVGVITLIVIDGFRKALARRKAEKSGKNEKDEDPRKGGYL